MVINFGKKNDFFLVQRFVLVLGISFSPLTERSAHKSHLLHSLNVEAYNAPIFVLIPSMGYLNTLAFYQKQFKVTNSFLVFVILYLVTHAQELARTQRNTQTKESLSKCVLV